MLPACLTSASVYVVLTKNCWPVNHDLGRWKVVVCPRVSPGRQGIYIVWRMRFACGPALLSTREYAGLSRVICCLRSTSSRIADVRAKPATPRRNRKGRSDRPTDVSRLPGAVCCIMLAACAHHVLLCLAPRTRLQNTKHSNLNYIPLTLFIFPSTLAHFSGCAIVGLTGQGTRS